MVGMLGSVVGCMVRIVWWDSRGGKAAWLHGHGRNMVDGMVGAQLHNYSVCVCARCGSLAMACYGSLVK